ncbi:hypothetical protein C4G66_RS14565 [Vibrio parahaemolyticus]|uniref:hypothetical protein n=1 Tax=Vibrio TaxID=662 RepID=UPI00211B05CE|nr:MULTISPECIES: hypothetical protein [Vibrio]EJG0988139.1 hypothetical protein [Vibrio parahaemolyticus]ELZ7199444.1 hypothetical protein [Vibrio parahaemolyticus]MCG6243627.1 hypothetical protein [Vibrio diabolicus]MDW1900646.1 hypothetical protein [Vibrio sp. Vb1337]HCE4734623.1 hypothetical protein [Vibrio parahaemolyticus]
MLVGLFINTQKLTVAKEDHLTEFFAAALRFSERFNRAFVRLIFGDQDSRLISKVETQVIYPGCRPDMRLILSDGSIVLCENKLDAAETIGNVESGNLFQLERYLQLPVDHVIYIRSELLPPSYQVMSHPKYLSPIEKPHYLWRDIYPLLCEDSNPIAKELRGGFKSMGFVPAHPVIGDLTRNAPRAQRENFSKFWMLTTTAAIQQGWKVAIGDVVERYFYHETAELAREVFVSPINPTRFLIRYTPQKSQCDALLSALDTVKSEAEAVVVVTKKTVSRASGLVTVIDVETPMNNVLPDQLKTVEQIESKLKAYVLPYLTLAFK